MPQAEYALTNESPHTRDRFSGLQALYDPVTVRHLEAVGLTAGWSCLEVGSGGGSVARWMGERVGPTGRVLVTDLDPRWVDATGSNLKVRRLDLRNDPVPGRAFDLVHARLVLQHLPERDAVLRRLVAALKPGGWLVMSEFDNQYPPCPDSGDERDALVNRVHDAFVAVITAVAGDVRYGRRLHRVFQEAGLVDVWADGHLAVVYGSSPGSLTMLANIRQVRPRLLEGSGMTDLDLERYETTLQDPTFSLLMPVLFTACGRRVGNESLGSS